MQQRLQLDEGAAGARPLATLFVLRVQQVRVPLILASAAKRRRALHHTHRGERAHREQADGRRGPSADIGTWAAVCVGVTPAWQRCPRAHEHAGQRGGVREARQQQRRQPGRDSK